MKKLWAVILTIMFVFSASAEGWRDGLSPSKPYVGSPEVDFNKTIGYMLLVPLNQETVEIDRITLQIFLPRTDVKVGSGTLKVYTAEGEIADEIAISEDTVIMRTMTNDELESLIWGSGTAFEIRLNKQLQPNTGYYVQMTEDIILSTEYSKGSWGIGNTTAWTFKTETSNYVDAFRYVNAEGEDIPEDGEVHPGDSAVIDIVLDKDCSAAIVCRNGNVLNDTMYFAESTETSVMFPEIGSVDWSVMFMDPDGKVEYSMNYETSVTEYVEPVE